MRRYSSRGPRWSSACKVQNYLASFDAPIELLVFPARIDPIFSHSVQFALRHFDVRMPGDLCQLWPLVLSFGQKCPDCASHLVGQCNRDQKTRLAFQHPAQPAIDFDLAAALSEGDSQIKRDKQLRNAVRMIDAHS